MTASFVNNLLPSDVQVLVKYDGDIHYANLSCPAGGGGDVYVDNEADDSHSNSLEKVWSSELSGNYIKINGWNDKAKKTIQQISATAGDYDVLMRHKNGSNYDTEYINVAPLLSSGAGWTGSLSSVYEVKWNPTYHRIEIGYNLLYFTNGLLRSVISSDYYKQYINTSPLY